MKFYLSSYELGNETDRLTGLAPKGKIGYIPNARDFTTADPQRKELRNQSDIISLREIGLEVELIDLKNYCYFCNYLEF